MAFKFNNNNNNDNGAKFGIVKYGAKVCNPRQIGENCITFTLKCDGFSLYNMRLIEGKHGERFVTPPQLKGSDGKYYNQYAIYLSDKDEQTIIDTLLDMLGGEDNGKH